MSLSTYLFAILTNVVLLSFFLIVTRHLKGGNRYTLVAMTGVFFSCLYFSLMFIDCFTMGKMAHAVVYAIPVVAGYIGMFIGTYIRDWRYRKSGNDVSSETEI